MTSSPLESVQQKAYSRFGIEAERRFTDAI